VRYLALIYLAPGQREGLRRYERSVLPVFKRHGGAFERIWTPVGPDAAPDAEAPDEIHLLRFRSRGRARGRAAGSGNAGAG
jgi:hypothetical protein